MRTPHPQQPNLPMAADPRLDLTFLYRTLKAYKRGNLCRPIPQCRPNRHPKYPRPNRPATRHRHRRRPKLGGFDQSAMGGTLPTGNGPSPANAGQMAAKRRSQPLLSTAPKHPRRPNNRTTLTRSVQPGGGILEFARPIPQPGSTISQTQGIDPASYGSQQTTQFNNLGKRPLRLGSTTTRHLPATLP